MEMFKKFNYKYVIVLLIGMILGLLCFGTYQFVCYQKVEQKEMKTSKKQKLEQEQKKEQEAAVVPESSKDATSQQEGVVEKSEEPLTTTLPVEKPVTPLVEETNPSSSEQDVITYFQEQEQLVEKAAKTGNTSLLDSVKAGFTTLGNFLFSGGTIKGYTFQELSTKAKLQVIKIALTVDHKIDSYFPNYKERIKSGFSNLKERAIAKYLEITAKVCENHADTCTQARIDFKNMKNSFGFTFSMIKAVLKEGSSAIREWYHSLS